MTYILFLHQHPEKFTPEFNALARNVTFCDIMTFRANRLKD